MTRACRRRLTKSRTERCGSRLYQLATRIAGEIGTTFAPVSGHRPKFRHDAENASASAAVFQIEVAFPDDRFRVPAWSSAAASSRVERFLRMRTPCSQPATRHEVVPFRFTKRRTTNSLCFMLRLPTRLATWPPLILTHALRETKMGRPTGLEPATPRSTILCSNQLSYDRRKMREAEFHERRQVCQPRFRTPRGRPGSRPETSFLPASRMLHQLNDGRRARTQTSHPSHPTILLLSLTSLPPDERV